MISSAGAAWFGGWRERSGWRTAQRLARATAAGARVGSVLRSARRVNAAARAAAKGVYELFSTALAQRHACSPQNKQKTELF